MKFIILSLLTCTGISLFAMEAESPRDQLKLVIKNNSYGEIEVFNDLWSKSEPRTVPEGGQLTISNPLKISTLKIKPHGKIKGMFFLERYTPNLVPKVQEFINSLSQKGRQIQAIVLTISFGLKEYAADFSILRKEEDSPRALKAQLFVLRNFPKVRDLYYKGSNKPLTACETIEARYLFQLPEITAQTSVDLIKKAVQESREKLNEYKQRMTSEQFNLVSQLIQSATDTIIAEKNAAMEQAKSGTSWIHTAGQMLSGKPQTELQKAYKQKNTQFRMQLAKILCETE